METLKATISRWEPHKNYLGNTKTQDTKRIKNARGRATLGRNTKEESINGCQLARPRDPACALAVRGHGDRVDPQPPPGLAAHTRPPGGARGDPTATKRTAHNFADRKSVV